MKYPIKNVFALVDSEDEERLKSRKWRVLTQGVKVFRTYAICSTYKDGKRGSLSMHRFILNAKPGQIVDHINGDGLDNRKCNLRFVTACQNIANRHHAPRSGHGTFGIYHHGYWQVNGDYVYPRKKRWQAMIQVEKKMKSLGYFRTKGEAVAARKQAEEKYAHRLGGVSIGELIKGRTPETVERMEKSRGLRP